TVLCVLACWAAFSAHAAAAEPFPRLGGVLIGDPRNYEDASYQQMIAKLDVAVMSVYPGWELAHGTTMEEVTKRIKALNPNIKIFLYFIPESQKYPSSAAWADLGAKLETQKWWLYEAAGSGTKVLSDFGRDTYILNITSYVPTDSSGLRLNQYLPRYVNDKLVKPNPSIDGIYTDNFFWKPRRDGDWNRDGTIDSQTSATVQTWYRQGFRTYLDGMKAAMPGKLQIGNIGDWGKTPAVLTEYDQQLHGGIIESVIGKSYSVESWAGWKPLLAHYRKALGALAAPKLGIFHQSGVPTDYQTFRYGFTTALLDDGYYAFNDGANGYSGVPWFDEYDVQLSGATSKPPTAAWQNGVYRRDFERGIALVNPKGNGTVEVTLERDFKKVSGSQDSVVNNGQSVRKVTLRDRDGIILMRVGGDRRPRAPTGVSLTPVG
ncbi:MAG: putative glycoside hydrolase, partial [Steroidobacteraceae bacterium]